MKDSIFGSILMAFVRSGGLNIASRCTCSLPGMFKGEIGTYLGDQVSILEKVFPDSTLLLEEGFVLFSWAPLSYRTYLAILCFSVSLLISPSRLRTLEDRNSVLLLFEYSVPTTYYVFNSDVC